MKKTLCFKLFLLLFILNSNCLYADDIWKTDFSNDIGKGYWSNTSDIIGITDWSLDVSNCTFANDDDYVKVVGTSGGRFEAKDCDGEVVWRSKSVDISGYTDISISVLLAETGSSTNSSKYAKVYYVIDGSEEILLELNGENSGNWGSVNATQPGLNGSNLEIVVRMNNPNAGDLVYFDNVVISGAPVIPESDGLTRILASDNPVESILLSVNSNDKENALPCFRFTIDETAEATDGLPTKVYGMTFYNSNPDNGMTWKDCIGGFCLFSNNEEIIPQNILIEEDSIVMDFVENQITIPDTEKMEFELRCYLNSDNPLTDGETFQFHCKESARGFSIFTSGSTFNSVNEMLSSAIHRVEVEATRMIFSECPDTLIRNQYFSVLIKAVDEFNNKDLDASQSLILLLEEGSGELESVNGFQNSFEKGEIIFDSLKYTIPEFIKLAVINDVLPKTVSNNILVGNTYESYVNVSNSYSSDSLISSLFIHETDAFEVFQFSLTDSGDDAVSTQLEHIKLIGSKKNQVNWEKTIEKFILKVDGEVLDIETSVDDDQLDIQFLDSELNREIPDEGNVVYSVFCFLKEGKTIDEELFQMEIDSLHAGWLISERGSGLSPKFAGNLTGAEFTLEVKANEMLFQSIPESVNYQEEFTILVQLIDSLGNIDTNSEFEIELSMASGNGELSSENLKLTSEDGDFRWADLIYSEAENFTIQAECYHFPTILSDNISGVDKTSVIGSDSPVLAKPLSSLAITKDDAIPIFNFKISDIATHDQLPTTISNLKFYNGYPDHSFSWSKHISGAVLLSNSEVIATTSDISEDKIEFNSSKGVLELANNSEMNLSLAIFFRKGQLPDNANIQVEIPKYHQWKCLGSGSNIQEVLSEDIRSEIHFINVEASELSFSSYPFGINNSNEKFSLKITACDHFSNVDEDAIGAVQLSLMNGDGELIIPDENLQVKNGIVDFDSIQYNGTADFRLKIESSFKSDSINIFFGEDELGIDENFESESLEKWINSSDWIASSYRPIAGEYSLKHNLSAEFGASYISKDLSGFDPKSGAISWSFIIRNGDWDPSSGNKFVFHLLMDDSDPNVAVTKYSVGVNQTGSSDILSLWNLDKDQNLDILLESEFNWNENEAVAIQLTYNPSGLWKMEYNRLGNKENWIVAGEIASEVNSDAEEWFSGLDFTFETASRAGNLWFDNLKIESINTAPFLKSYEIVGQDSLFLEYSEDLDFSASSKIENFKLGIERGESFEFEVLPGNTDNYLLLVLDNDLRTGDYQLEISNITDAKGATQKYETIQFEYFAPAKPSDVVINEIMADETPSAGLPEYEFIELYNASEYPIVIENWIVKVGEKETVLDLDTIAAKAYLVLCSKSAVEEFSSFADVLGVSSFPGLTNSGGAIEIQSAEKIVIDQVSYSDSWYQSDEKSDGGWSLERIDPENTSWQENNWKVSVSELGGTPGKLNSIYTGNQDFTAPCLECCRSVSGNCLQLIFSEPIDSSGVFKLSNFKLSSEVIHPMEVNQTDIIGKEFYLYFQDDFVKNSQYQLVLSNEIKDLAGNSILTKEYEFWVPGIISEGDLVINEVLFNPYPDGSDYVEIVNVSDKVIDLSQIELAARTDNFELFGEVSISDKFLHPKEYILVAEDTLNVHQNYFTSNPDVFCQIKSLPSFSDDAGRVVITSNNEIIDDFAYNEDMHFELLASVEGVSLERINPIKETNRKSNWQSAAQNIGFGTPGLQNSVYNDADLVESEISLSSQIFTPDNDGIDDRLLINFKMEEDGFLTSIRIYNSMGIEIRKLASNVNLANEDSLFWDGLTSKKERASIGIYLIYIELFSANGEVRIYKKTCVLGGKFN